MPAGPGPTPVAGNETSSPGSNVATSGSSEEGDSPFRSAGSVSAGNSSDITAQPFIVQYAQDIYATNYQESNRVVANIDVQFAPCILIIDATSGNITITLPSARALSGKTITMMRADNTAGRTITVTTNDGNVRTTTAVAAILGTQYGSVDYTASAHLDSAGTGVEVIWIGR